MFSDFLNLFFFDRNARHRRRAQGAAVDGGVPEPRRAEPDCLQRPGSELPRRRRVPDSGGVRASPATVTVMFKEFGIRLTFKPTIAGDVIRLKVRPEVSSLDFNNGLTLSGFRIPSLTTRRAETDVELRDGQTFAIAGLLDNISQNDGAAIPLLSKLPIIGPLFKSTSKRAEQTELMVLITPRLVRPLEPDEVPPLPTTPKPFIKKPGARGDSRRHRRAARRRRRLVDAPAAPAKRKPSGRQ